MKLHLKNLDKLYQKEMCGLLPAHKGEDETVLKAHKQLGGLLIIVPRHTERASEIERLASSMGFVAKYALRRLT